MQSDEIRLAAVAPSRLLSCTVVREGDEIAAWIGLDGYVRYDETLTTRPALGPGNSDALLEIICRAVVARGRSVLDTLAGDFVLVYVEPSSRIVLVYRSRSGGRSIHFSTSPSGFRFASWAADLQASAETAWQENQPYLTNLFALQYCPAPGETPFASIQEVTPGQCLCIENNRLTATRQAFRWSGESVGESWAEAFEAAYEQAVADSLGQTGPVGLQLSGGLDSGSVAVEAKRLLDARNRRLIPTSWLLHQFPEADESRWIDLLCDFLGLQARTFPADSMLPFSRLTTSIINPGTPVLSAFREATLKCYELASAEGCRTVLSGHGGDQIYPPRRYLLIDMVRRGHWMGVWHYLSRTCRNRGLHGLLQDPAIRFPAGKLIRFRRGRPRPPEWLTPLASKHWRPAPYDWPPEADDHPYPAYARAMLGPRMTLGLPIDNEFAARYGLEQNNPFQDERLIRLMLQMPVSLAFANGQDKSIMRKIMTGKMPERLRTKGRTGLLNSFFHAGFNANRARIQRLLFEHNREWQHYVKPEFVEATLAGALTTEKARMVVSQCIGYALWRQYWSHQ